MQVDINNMKVDIKDIETDIKALIKNDAIIIDTVAELKKDIASLN